ncbi:MAG: HEAT repeat domain-containing protein [Phycisphaerae bacterium]
MTVKGANTCHSRGRTRRLRSDWAVVGLCAVLGPFWIIVATANADADPSPDAVAGQWMLDYARHLGLQSDSPPSVGQVRTLLVWLQAATRLDPALADAYHAQRDLWLLLGQSDRAFDALRQYCQLHEADHAERLAYLTQAFDRLQTADKRVEFCRTHLESTGLPAPLRSELHRLMAETLAGIGDLDAAKAHARQSVEAYCFNFTARRLEAELESQAVASHQQVEFLLTSIAAAPQRPEPMWQLARLLDALSLHDRALPWYSRSADLLSAGPDGDAGVPFALRLDAVRSLRDAGNLEGMLKWSSRIEANPDEQFELATLMVERARRAGRDDLVQANLPLLRGRIAEWQGQADGKADVESEVRVAWFYIHTDPNPEKALEFSKRAVEAAPEDATVQRIRGLALVLAERWPDAQAILGPLCVPTLSDAWAGWGLARALVGLGQEADAVAILRDAEQLRRSGPAYERIVELLEQLGEVPLPKPEHRAVLAALDSFDERVLEFPQHPERFCGLTIAPADPHPRYADAWRAKVTLTNQGPFAITIGPGQMIDGDVLVSARAIGLKQPAMDGYLPIRLTLRPVLEPGERLDVVTRLDLGPVADLALTMPQREVAVTFEVTLDSGIVDGTDAQRGVAGKLTASVTIVRPGLRYDRAGAAALSAELRDPSAANRARALATVAGLLVERLAVMGETVDYTPVRIDRRWLEEVLLAGLKDPDAMVRARAGRALARLQLRSQEVQALAPLLSDAHWLVRLVAVDVLSRQQGRVFTRVAERLAKTDPDPLVRELAALHRERMAVFGSSDSTPAP